MPPSLSSFKNLAVSQNEHRTKIYYFSQHVFALLHVLLSTCSKAKRVEWGDFIQDMFWGYLQQVIMRGHQDKKSLVSCCLVEQLVLDILTGADRHLSQTLIPLTEHLSHHLSCISCPLIEPVFINQSKQKISNYHIIFRSLIIVCVILLTLLI